MVLSLTLAVLSFDYEQAVHFRKKDLCPFHTESVHIPRKVQEPIRGPCSDTCRVKWPFKESESLLLVNAAETSDHCEMFVFLSVNKTKWKATAPLTKLAFFYSIINVSPICAPLSLVDSSIHNDEISEMGSCSPGSSMRK